MPSMARTPTLIRPQIDAVRNALVNTVVPSTGAVIPWPIGNWQRPRVASMDPEAHARYTNPPFINVRNFPSAADMDGPIDDSQADVRLRVQIQSVGDTDIQALQVQDLTREIMADRSNLTIPNRYIQNLKLMIVSGGITRDDDILPAVFYDYDVYELWTTPNP